MSNTSNRYPQELKGRAIRLVGEVRDQYGSEWEAIESVASKLGIASAEMRKLRAEVRELRRANEIPTAGGCRRNLSVRVRSRVDGHRPGARGGDRQARR
jgi:transposase-like protein